MVCHSANARLLVSAGSAAETSCYSDNDDVMPLTVRICNCGSDYEPYYTDVECPDNFADAGATCYLGSVGDTHYYCDVGGESACSFCACYSHYTNWSTIGNNRLSRQYINIDESDYEECKSTTSTEYGCAAGYYKSAGSGSTMTCSRCPSSNGIYGTNAAGTTDITTCYIPSGSTYRFSDDTGSGTAKLTSNCYYNN